VERRRIIRKRLAGKSANAIARELHRSDTTVRAVARRAGIQVDTPAQIERVVMSERETFDEHDARRGVEGLPWQRKLATTLIEFRPDLTLEQVARVAGIASGAVDIMSAEMKRGRGRSVANPGTGAAIAVGIGAALLAKLIIDRWR
jgi:hypothetical protein